jgi:hypothetical protein
VKLVVADLKALSRRPTGEMRTPKNMQALIVAVLVEQFKPAAHRTRQKF